MSRLVVVRHGTSAPLAGAGDTVISTDQLKGWLRSGALVTRVGRWSETCLRTDRLATLGRPLPTALLLRLLARGACYAEDAGGARRALSLALLTRWAGQVVTEFIGRGAFLAAIERDVAALEQEPVGPHDCAAAAPGAGPLYIRADLSFELKAGGSVSHTVGVVNQLSTVVAPPIVLTTARMPTIADGIETHDIDPDEAYWHYRELPAFALNRAVLRTARQVVAGRPLAFLYQRYALSGYAAIQLARELRVPLVTEYNGSEVWVARHWGQPLVHEDLSARIERLNLRASHLVTVVSQPLAEEVARLGVDPTRILVNPNGVDPDRYHPKLEGASVRTRHGLGGATVIGFIGTFGPWHGAEVLADAFVRLLAQHPQYRTSVKLLWIGDGATLPRVRDIVRDGGVDGNCVFTGLVPQADGPEYLAACDILASPHVPNADGTPFFGSPTKLFEYMAMGRAIVASDLDQVGEILEQGTAAQMVEPGNVEALAHGLLVLLRDPERRRLLGAEARRLAVERHSWHAHVARIVRALQSTL